MFVFSTTFKLFRAETCVADLRQALKIWTVNSNGQGTLDMIELTLVYLAARHQVDNIHRGCNIHIEIACGLYYKQITIVIDTPSVVSKCCSKL